MKMKPVRRVLFVVIVAAGLLAYFGLDRFLKHTIESQSSASLRLATTLQSARLAVFGGKLKLHDYQIASPKGFSAPHMLELGGLDVDVKYGQLRNDPVHIESIALDKPRLVIEQSNGVINFRKAMEGMPKSRSSDEPLRMVINELKLQDAQVVLHPGLPGLQQEIVVPVPSLLLKNIGSGQGADNGAAIKDVAMVVITALAGAAAESGAVPAQLKALLHLNVSQVAASLGAEAQKQIAAAVPGELGQGLSKAAGDPEAVIKDPGKALQGGVGDFLGGKKNDSAPAGRAPPPKR